MNKMVDNSPKKPTIKAVGLLSGGLDSTLAAKLMLEQGIDVHLINFISPFFSKTHQKTGHSTILTAMRHLGHTSLKRIAIKDDYMMILRNPKYGYGKGMNPCIDCRIMTIQKAGDYMHQIDASFLFTGEVLGQRPMSQHKKAMDIIDRDSGLRGYIVRPLSAALLEPTIPEQNGWIDRNGLLAISGRSRKIQIVLAAKKGIRDYPSPAGGCLLTDKNFSERFRDYLRFAKSPSLNDVPLLKVGRHFRLENGDKVIVARNQDEGDIMRELFHERDHLLIPQGFSGPVVILQGVSFDTALQKMLHYTKKTIPSSARIGHWHKGRSRIIPLNAG